MHSWVFLSFQYSMGCVFYYFGENWSQNPSVFYRMWRPLNLFAFSSVWLSFLVLLYDCERYFSQYFRCLIQTVSFFYQKDRPTKLSQILGVSHLLFNSKCHQCRGMFCVSLLASHLDAYTWEKGQTVRKLGLLSHFDCFKIGVHWLIFVNCLSSCTWKLKSWSEKIITSGWCLV